MAEEKKEKEKAVPVVCVCGKVPCTVKHKSKHMLSCPDILSCSMRNRWASTEQAAITDWNTTIQSARNAANCDT